MRGRLDLLVPAGLTGLMVSCSALGLVLGCGKPAARKPAAPSSVPGSDSPVERPRSRIQVKGAAAEDAIPSLPYITGTRDPRADLRGVTLHLRGRAAPGLNLWCSTPRQACILFDLDGQEVWRWRLPFPGSVDQAWISPEGSLTALVADRAVVRIDRDSRELWRYSAPVHHSLAQASDGGVWALARRRVLLPEIHASRHVWEDLLLRLHADGTLAGETSLLRVVQQSPFAFLLPSDLRLDATATTAESAAAGDSALDLLHANHVEELEGSSQSRLAAFSAGNLLLSFRNISSILVFEPASQEIRWLWGPYNLSYQHDPSALANGNVLVFDNGSPSSRRSAVLELDPVRRRTTWSYAPGTSFYTATRGHCQRLPNGNTLITESNRGYAFEITAAGEKVWEWANPEVTAEGERGFVWSVTRWTPDQLGFLAVAGDVSPGTAAN